MKRYRYGNQPNSKTGNEHSRNQYCASPKYDLDHRRGDRPFTKESVINIGRKLENHIAIDDPRISREHAQLRALNGHFVLFDLNSTGGTFVNGQRTQEVVLYPGDLISLAGVTLIYAQNDQAQPTDLVETAPLDSSEVDQLSTPTRDNITLDIKGSGSKPQKP